MPPAMRRDKIIVGIQTFNRERLKKLARKRKESLSRYCENVLLKHLAHNDKS